jgi:hypothetical protein
VPWDVDGAGLAEVVRTMLDDAAALVTLGERGHAYATSWTFDDVAERLLSVLRGLAPARP